MYVLTVADSFEKSATARGYKKHKRVYNGGDSLLFPVDVPLGYFPTLATIKRNKLANTIPNPNPDSNPINHPSGHR